MSFYEQGCKAAWMKLGMGRTKIADPGALMRDIPETNNLAWRLQQVLKNISPAKGVTRPY